MKTPIQLTINADEVALLRHALDHAIFTTSERHPEYRARLQALVERLNAAEKRS